MWLRVEFFGKQKPPHQ